jgi:hypothetical protein
MCRRVTSHKVTQDRSGGGNRLSETSTCEGHVKLPNGRPPIDKRST